MLRGVNKRIIEVNDTGSDMFEKALFFVKSGKDISDERLEKEAHRIIGSYFASDTQKEHKGYLRYTEEKRKRRLIFGFFCGAVAFLLAAAGAWLYF